MALILDDSNIEVVCFIDDAIDRQIITREIYDSYLENLDEKKLNLSDSKQPTRFIMRKVIDYKTQKKIKKDQFKFASSDMQKLRKGEAEVELDLLGGPSEYVRAAIIDIKHPSDVIPGRLSFKKGDDGFLHDEVMALLSTFNIVDDLYKAWDNQVNDRHDKSKKN